MAEARLERLRLALDQDGVAIGTSYLKLALDDFDGSMALAAAGYNAGPGRPKNWRNGPVIEGAIWAENVPFHETRDYVKKVLANTTNRSRLCLRAHSPGEPLRDGSQVRRGGCRAHASDAGQAPCSLG